MSYEGIVDIGKYYFTKRGNMYCYYKVLRPIEIRENKIIEGDIFVVGYNGDETQVVVNSKDINLSINCDEEISEERFMEAYNIVLKQIKNQL